MASGLPKPSLVASTFLTQNITEKCMNAYVVTAEQRAEQTIKGVLGGYYECTL